MSDLDPELRELLAPIREATRENAHGSVGDLGARAARGARPGDPRLSPPRGHEPRVSHVGPRSEGARSLTDTELSAAARERILGTMRQQVRGVPRARRRARIVRRMRFGALFGASLLACGALFWPQLGPGAYALLARGGALLDGAPTTSDGGALHIAAAGQSPLAWTGSQGDTRELRGELDLPGDGELQVPVSASALLTTASGVRIDAAERTRVRLRGAAGARAQGLALERGHVRCRVPPLGKGQSFVVSTADTRVVVHGTDFSVELGGEARAAASASPCVRVREGLVEVQHEGAPSAWLGPGSAWGCADEVASTHAPLVSSAVASAEVSPAADLRSRGEDQHANKSHGHHHHGRGRAVSKAHRVDRSLLVEASSDATADDEVAAPAASTLERENQLLADGLRAEQTGDQARARKLFGSLLTQYPNSPLAPEARAGIARTKFPRAE